jgi:DNA-binding PadR family transcriptional regulator
MFGHGHDGHGHGRGHHGPFGRHHGAGGWFDMFRQGTPRARRGDIRAGILALLKEGPRNGYQLMQELSERSGGVWRPSPGSVYPALQLLEDEGLVAVDASQSGKTYALTKKGVKHVEENAEEIGEPWKRVSQEPGASGDDMIELMKLVKLLAPAVMQLVATGSASQLKEARKILGEARKKLYRLLADDVDEEEDDAK